MEMWEKIKKQNQLKIMIGGISLVIILIFVGGFFLLKKPPEKELPDFLAEERSTQEEKIETSTTEEVTEIYVDIKGAVKNPGVYRLKSPARIFEGIEKAGGFLTEADVKKVNLAKILTDQSQLYVPEIGEEGKWDEGVEEVEVREEDKPTSGKININQSDVNELQQLPGIGAKKAEAIIQYRQENGSFQKLEDLTQVAGIGEGTFAKLKDLITN